MHWTVVIPAKALSRAKSRLLSASVDAAGHRELVQAIRADTLASARAATDVARILVVTDRDPATAPASAADWPQAIVLVQTSSGLNAALREAAAHAAEQWPDDGIAALVGDLPALQPADLADALAAAGHHQRAHVPDAAGTGTTLLAAQPGVELAPAFGDGSAGRHAASGATALDAAPGLRADVDTAEDLRVAADLRVGPATASVLAANAVAAVTARSTGSGMMCR